MTPEQIIKSHREAVIKRGEECKSVLVVQDTTEVSYTSHRKVKGLGFINQSKQRGIKLHSCLAVSREGEPLGLLHQEGWSRKQRKGKKEQRKKLPIAQKESYRWLTTLSAAEAGWEESAHLVHIADREADIFELFAHPRRRNSDLLIRAQQNRKIEHELGYLMVAGAQGPVLGRVEIELQRNPKRKARRAQLCCRAMGVRLDVPKQHGKSAGLEPIELNVIWVEEEEQPEDGTQPIRWVLLTTLPIEKFEQVWQCVQWYTHRWLIERFHYTLKSGCGVEELQLNTQERLHKGLAVYSIVAWRVMWMLYYGRSNPEESCEKILHEEEWQLLRRKFAPRSRKKPPKLQQAIVWIARLGGFLARKGDGMPGVKTLWRGLTALQLMVEGGKLMTRSCPP